MTDNHSFNHQPDLSIFVLDAGGGTMTETVASRRFERMTVQDRARLLAALIGQVWELARDYDESGTAPMGENVRGAIREYWADKADGANHCDGCGSEEIDVDGNCERCGL